MERRSFALCLVLALAVRGAGACPDAEAALEATNALREAQALPRLRWSMHLEVASQAWADFVAEKGCVAESSGARGEAVFVSAEDATCAAASAAFAKDLAAAEDEMEVGKRGLLTQAATEMGCATATFKDGNCTMVVCLYSPVEDHAIAIGHAAASRSLFAVGSKEGRRLLQSPPKGSGNQSGRRSLLQSPPKGSGNQSGRRSLLQSPPKGSGNQSGRRSLLQSPPKGSGNQSGRRSLLQSPPKGSGNQSGRRSLLQSPPKGSGNQSGRRSLLQSPPKGSGNQSGRRSLLQSPPKGSGNQSGR